MFIREWLTENLAISEVRHRKIPWNVLFSFTIWDIWKRRNKWIFKKQNENEESFIKNVVWFAQEWFFFAQPTTPSTKSIVKPLQKWLPPPLGLKKINVDASYLHSNFATGIGGLCRDHRGTWIKGFSAKTYCRNSKEAEYQAIWHGLQWAREENWENFTIASNCKQAIEEIKEKEEIKDLLTHIKNWCRIYLEQVGGTLVHEKREANGPADAMAKLARADPRRSFGFECIATPSPECIELIRIDSYAEPNMNGDDSSFVSLNRARP